MTNHKEQKGESLLIAIGLLILITLFSGTPKYTIPKASELTISIGGVDISEINKQIPNLNSGGCGYFAMKLYKVMGKGHSIIVLGNYRHVAILEHKTGYLIDSNGYHALEGSLFNGYYKIVTYEQLRKRVYENFNWNPSFDRRDTVKINKFLFN